MRFVLSRMESTVLVNKIYCYYCVWGKKYALGLGQNGQLALDIHIFLANLSGGCDRKPVYLKRASLKRQYTQKWANVWTMITFQHKTIEIVFEPKCSLQFELSTLDNAIHITLFFLDVEVWHTHDSLLNLLSDIFFHSFVFLCFIFLVWKQTLKQKIYSISCMFSEPCVSRQLVRLDGAGMIINS